jgi:hypothetical protein
MLFWLPSLVCGPSIVRKNLNQAVMKTRIQNLFVALAIFSIFTAQLSTARAQGTAFTYNGKLSVGGNPANGIFDLRFAICDAVTNGNIYGVVTNSATGITNGLFTATLDFGGVFNGSNYWLEIAARTNGGGAFTTLSPREPVMPTPYAIYSANAGSALTANTAGTAASANSVSAAHITGTVQLTQLPGTILTNNESGVTLSGAFSVGGLTISNTSVTAIGSGANLNLQGGTTGINAGAQVTLGGSGGGFNGASVTLQGGNNSINVPGSTLIVEGGGAGYGILLNTPGNATIIQGGNVGIGTINPATTLDVNGTVRATNFIGNGSGLTNVPGTFVWQTISGTTQTASPNQSYLLTNSMQSTVTLPASANVGDVVTVSGVGSGGWQVSPNTGQMIVGYSGAGGLTWTARASNQNWSSVASSSDGTKLTAVGTDGSFYTSSDSGATWAEPNYFPLNWWKVASSADGTKLVLAPFSYNGSIYTSGNSGATLTARFNAQNGGWNSLASSSDGTRLVATDGYGNGGIGQIYTSTNSGVAWSVQNSAPMTNWTSVASSADGTKLVATTLSGQIYTSANSGVIWTAQSSDSQNWEAVASSADGTMLVAVPYNAPIYTSTNSGVTWTAQSSGSRGWNAVASSADGTRLVATVGGGQIYTSTNSGVNWTAQNSGNQLWYSIASSADGTKLVAVVYGGQIYTSGPSPLPFAGITGSTAQFQYVGNGLWQPLGESAGQITGTISVAQLPPVVVTNNSTGLVLSGAFSGNGAGLTNLNVAQLPGTVLTNNQSGVTLNGTFSGNGAGLTNLNVAGTLSWQTVTGTSQQAQSNTGYLITNSAQVTIALPASPNVGDIVSVSSAGSGGWQISQGNQYLFTGSEINITLNPGTYEITALGAQGGSGVEYGGGDGAEMEAQFNFATATNLTLMVGGSGGSGDGGGGGGGSFVINGSTPLLIAGGGGGGGGYYGNGGSGNTGTNGSNGNSSGFGYAGSGGTAGNGGGGGNETYAGGGGGFYSGGTNGLYGSGGNGFFTGYAGGFYSDGAFGGYGGGGNGGYFTGGGGGGYSGGGCGDYFAGGGGGGSFIASSATTVTNLAGVQSGNGEINIAQVYYTGGQSSAIELQYVGNGQWQPVNFTGTITTGANTLGAVSLAQLPGAVVTNNETVVNLSGTFTGNGNGLTNVNASAITGGVTTNILTSSTGGHTLYITNGIIMKVQ